MKKGFYYYKTSDCYFLESIDTGSFFSLGKNEFTLFQNNNDEIIDVLIKNKVISKHKNSDTFSIMVLMNNFCNLNCTYCFENKKSKKNEEISDTIINHIIENFKLNNDITFTGGEPLLSFNKIQKICDYLEHKKINATFSIVTNGLNLNETILNYLNKHKFEVQISLDGSIPKNNCKNDRTNIFVESIILKNIDKIVENYNSIKLTLRINFSKKDLNTYKQRINSLLDYFQDNLDKISFDFKLVDLPINDEQYLPPYDRYQAYKKMYKFLHSKKLSLPSNFIDGGYCMARNKNIILINQQGYKFPCFSFVDYDEFNLDNNNNFYNYSINCKKICHLYDICMGGCIYGNFCDTGYIKSQCNYKYLDSLNRQLFLYKLIELGYIDSSRKDEVNNVKEFIIDI